MSPKLTAIVQRKPAAGSARAAYSREEPMTKLRRATRISAPEYAGALVTNSACGVPSGAYRRSCSSTVGLIESNSSRPGASWSVSTSDSSSGTATASRPRNGLMRTLFVFNFMRWLTLPPHALDSRSDCGLVAHESAREVDQNRYNGRQLRSLRHVSDGRGRDPTTIIRFDHVENYRFAIAPNVYGNMSTPTTVRGKTTGRCALMSLQQVYPWPVADFPIAATVRAADDFGRIEYPCHMGNPV